MSKEKKAEKKEAAALASLPKEGHNSRPGKNPALIGIFTDVEKLELRRKEINQAIKEIMLDAKEKHGVSTSAFRHELRMRRMEEQARREFEHNCENIKHMLGYQFALPLAGAGEKISDEADPAEVAKRESAKHKEASKNKIGIVPHSQLQRKTVH